MNKNKIKVLKLSPEYKHDESLSHKQFILNFIRIYNEKYMTVYKNGSTQCSRRRLRSLGDISSIVKYYYPTSNKTRVKNILINMKGELVGHYCPGIKKRVYTSTKVYPTYVQSSKGLKDEYRDKITYR